MRGVLVTLEELIGLRAASLQLNLPLPNSVGSTQQGNFHSKFRGRGMDFVETRSYQPGDDVRTINWAVTARTGKPHTKIYQQERDRPVYLIIDFNPAMYFGTRKVFKSVAAAYAATIIAWAGMHNGNRVGALLIKDHHHVLMRPYQKKQNLVEFFKQLTQFTQPTYHEKVDYFEAFRQLKKEIRGGSLIYFFSDFYFLDQGLESELMQLAKHHDVNNVFIFDPLEKELPKGGAYLFHDQIKTSSLLVDTHHSSLRQRYHAIFNHRLEALKKLCSCTGMRKIEIGTHEDIAKVLRRFLAGKKYNE